jgi:hypothetical protein
LLEPLRPDRASGFFMQAIRLGRSRSRALTSTRFIGDRQA